MLLPTFTFDAGDLGLMIAGFGAVGAVLRRRRVAPT